eukprot:gene13772-16240_t
MYHRIDQTQDHQTRSVADNLSGGQGKSIAAPVIQGYFIHRKMPAGKRHTGPVSRYIDAYLPSKKQDFQNIEKDLATPTDLDTWCLAQLGKTSAQLAEIEQDAEDRLLMPALAESETATTPAAASSKPPAAIAAPRPMEMFSGPAVHSRPAATAASSSVPKGGRSRRKSTPVRKAPEEQGTEVIVDKKRLDIPKIYQFLERFRKPSALSLKMRTEGQRLELHTAGSADLKAQLGSRKKKKGGKQYIDPSYHETVQYIDIEYGRFCAGAAGVLNEEEMRTAYDILLARQSASVSGSAITASGPSPLTSMTSSLLGMYQNLHYRTTLLAEDETASTRSYEAAYTAEVHKELPMSQARPFVLPAESGAAETTMVNSIGATLDVQVPTTGTSIGSGKIYSAIYKHFQKSMELLNRELDNSQGKYVAADPKAFEKRTRAHMAAPAGSFMAGLYQNEKDNFKPSSDFLNWPALSATIMTLVGLISQSLKLVPEKIDEAFTVLVVLDNLTGSSSAIVKQFELIGTIIGLMIKAEKRQLLNHQMFGKDKDVKQCLENLYQLSRVEAEINKQIPGSKYKMGQLIRAEQERRNIKKDLLGLEGLRRILPGGAQRKAEEKSNQGKVLLNFAFRPTLNLISIKENSIKITFNLILSLPYPEFFPDLYTMMQDYIFEIQLKVRDYECDIQGVVNNAVYQSYLEHARHEYLQSKNISFKALTEKNILLMVSRIEMDFKQSLTSGDVFTVKLRLERQGLKMVFFQDIFRLGDGALCLKGKVEAIAKVEGKLSRGEIFDTLNL